MGPIISGSLLVDKPQLSDQKDYLSFPGEAVIQTNKASVLLKRPMHFSEEKEMLNPESLISLDSTQQTPPFLASFSEGVDSDSPREVIFQPQLPKYPEWIEQQLKAEFLVFNVYISSDGLVEQLICVQASGNPELDTAFARYISRWHFAPATQQGGVWQQVKIDLDKDD